MKRTADEGRKVVRAEEILAEILEKNEKGEDVVIKDKIIKGDLDLSTHTVSSKIKIVNSEILGKLIFINTIFKKSVEFESVRFFRDATFEKSKFQGNANFKHVHFGSESSPYERSRFVGAHFDKNANFAYTHFWNSAVFNSVNFGGKADFMKVQFHNGAFFIGTQFSKDVYFDYSTEFNINASFERSKFGEDVTFENTIFNSNAYFKAATFNGFTNFMEAWFRDNADFTEAKFEGDTRFNNVHFDNNLILIGARINSMALNNSQFKKESEILLKQAIFNRLYLKWDEIKTHLKYRYDDEYDWATYSALVKNFRDLVRYDDADNCYYEFRKKHQDAKSWLRENKSGISRFDWSKLYDHISWRSCGYGVRLRFTIACISATIFIFGLLFWDISKITILLTILSSP